MTQTMTPARNRSRTMKIKLMIMAITRPLEKMDRQVKKTFKIIRQLTSSEVLRDLLSLLTTCALEMDFNYILLRFSLMI